MPPKNPYANTRLSAFLTKRILELRPRKSQLEIAAEALEVDPRMLFKMAIEQSGYETTSKVIDEIFGTIVSRNEVSWLKALREASDNKDPALTTRSRAALRGIFNK